MSSLPSPMALGSLTGVRPAQPQLHPLRRPPFRLRCADRMSGCSMDEVANCLAMRIDAFGEHVAKGLDK